MNPAQTQGVPQLESDLGIQRLGSRFTGSVGHSVLPFKKI